MAPERDRKIEAQLRESAPEIDWSVKNQTRLHWRDGDAPYGSATDAMRQWPETAPSTAVCCVDAGSWELAALLGIGDLVTGDLCVGAQFSCERQATFAKRVRDQGWLGRWPRVWLG